MKHHDKNRKFGRESGVRRALLRSLITSLVSKEKIVTTEAKAKEIRPRVEKLITHAKKGTLSVRRLIRAELFNNEKTADKLIRVIAPRYEKRLGGYTRIVKLPVRKSDGSKMALIEFV